MSTGIPVTLLAFGLGWYTCSVFNSNGALQEQLKDAQEIISVQKSTIDAQILQKSKIQEVLDAIYGSTENDNGPLAPVYVDGIKRLPNYGE
jgi:hypothetical protein